jgi:lipopolysaccharide export system permease protein
MARHRLFRLQTEPWRRWANGFSCFFFVVAGIPLAIRLRNSDVLTSFFLCFLPILLVYYPLLAFGVDRAKGGVLPPYTVWLGNVFLLLAGLWLLRKVLRY